MCGEWWDWIGLNGKEWGGNEGLVQNLVECLKRNAHRLSVPALSFELARTRRGFWVIGNVRQRWEIPGLCLSWNY